MRRRVWAWLALSSLCLGQLAGETRPHYGGTLTVEETVGDQVLGSSLSIPVTEPLVRLGARGEFEPVLAVAWQHDPDFKRWRLSLRTKVLFHDGQPLTAASAAPSLLESLRPKYADVSIEAGGQALVIKSGQPMPSLLGDLTDAPVMRAVDVGTGPFRVAARDKFLAFDDYWGGRPYLDGVIVKTPGAGGADMVSIPIGPSRRIVPEGWTTWSSVPKALLAIQGVNVEANVLKALALAIDRAPLANVLAQHKAEPAFGLLPQWLSGYEFLFQYPPDLARARQIIAQLRPAPLTIDAPANDAFERSMAERIALNARDAGITIQFKPAGDLRLVHLPLQSKKPAFDLARVRAQLNLDDLTSLDGAPPEALYQFERAVIDKYHIIPLLHLRESYAISPHAHFHPSSDQFALHFEDAWIEP
jgi:hypothetical protein